MYEVVTELYWNIALNVTVSSWKSVISSFENWLIFSCFLVLYVPDVERPPFRANRIMVSVSHTWTCGLSLRTALLYFIWIGLFFSAKLSLNRYLPSDRGWVNKANTVVWVISSYYLALRAMNLMSTSGTTSCEGFLLPQVLVYWQRKAAAKKPSVHQ